MGGGGDEAEEFDVDAVDIYEVDAEVLGAIDDEEEAVRTEVTSETAGARPEQAAWLTRTEEQLRV